ncbi:MAG TPA: site-specific integrase [Streptosporangiaceae bacterium]|nr:site-specific integrase [Streptosporangiaceae bacterium]
MGHVQDLWYSAGDDSEDRPTARHGKGKRWKARWIDPDGQEKSQAFTRKTLARRPSVISGWLAGLPVGERYVGSGLGLRQGEITGLPLDGLDFLRRNVRVRLQVRLIGKTLVFAPPKGGRERDVPLPDPVGLALAAHLEEFPARTVTLPWREPGGKPRTETLVFVTSNGPIHRNGFNSYVWHPARRKARVPAGRENGMHALRHHYASVLLSGGMDIGALSEFLGHHDPDFTLRVYT